MRKPSRILASATAVLLFAAASPTTAANLPVPRTSPATSRSAPDPATRTCHGLPRSEPDPVRAEARQPAQGPVLLDWWRQWWAAATSRRDARQADAQRPARTPFYLRSPMLSGFFGWGEPIGCVATRPAERKTSTPHAPAALRGNADTNSADIGPVPHHR